MKEKEVYEKFVSRSCLTVVHVSKTSVLGVDFQESFAPVINDVTFRILLIMMLTWNLKGKIVDIETAFCMETSRK
jgi:hypothetical protein